MSTHQLLGRVIIQPVIAERARVTGVGWGGDPERNSIVLIAYQHEPSPSQPARVILRLFLNFNWRREVARASWARLLCAARVSRIAYRWRRKRVDGRRVTHDPLDFANRHRVALVAI